MAFTDRLANRGSISTGYDIEYSCKFEGANNEWVYLNSPTAGNRDIFTFSFWFKRTESKDAIVVWQGTHGRIRFQSDDIRFRFASGHELETTRKIRDYSAWYHLVIACDSTQGTAANRVKMYVNGVQETAFETATYPDQNDDSALMTTDNLYLSAGDGDFDYSGYIADFCIIDGTQYAASDFGEFDEDSGIWKPKDLSELTFGSEGVWLKFDDSSSLGADSSGNSNDFTLNNIAAADQSTDTPTNNFCTWSPLWDFTVNGTISEGGTALTHASGTSWGVKASIGVQNGKWYWEAKPVGIIGAQYIGIQTDGDSNINTGTPISNAENFVVTPEGYHYKNGGTETNFSVTFDTDDIMGIALDLDSATNTFKLYKNNSLELTYNLWADITDVVVIPFCQLYEDRKFTINFGGYTLSSISSAASDANGYGTFEYAPPSGYYAICTKNLAEFG